MYKNKLSIKLFIIVMIGTILLFALSLTSSAISCISSIQTGEVMNMNVSDNLAYLRFEPKYSGSYCFSSDSNVDTMGYIYDSNDNLLYEDDDSGDDFNFSITYTLNEGEVYYLGVKLFGSDENGIVKVSVRLLDCPHNSYIYYDETPATSCAEPGYTAGTYCLDCNMWIEGHTEITKAHTFSNIISKADATNKKSGKITPTCTICKATKNSSTISYPKTISLSPASANYTGSKITPSVTVKNASGKTVAASNYTVSYSNNKNVGKAIVTVTFKGDYTGKLVTSFNILPKGTELNTLTAKTEGFSVKWKKQSSQTTGYQIQYSTSSSFESVKTVKISDNSETITSISSLKGNTKYYVRIRTYKTVDNKNYYSSWSAKKSVTTKPSIGISLSLTNATLYIGQSKTLKPIVHPSDSKITWKSGDSSVATVSSSGKVKALKKGTTTITASMIYNGKTYKTKCEITVKKPYLKISESTISLKEGDTYKMTATAKPENVDVTWSSSNKSVATVNSSGKVTAKNPGTTTITAKFVYNGTTYSAKCTIKVKIKPGIKILSVYDYDDDYYTTTLGIKYKNCSDKDIISVKFVTYFFDDEYNYVPDAEGYKFFDTSGLEPGKTSNPEWKSIYTYEAVHGIYIKEAVVTFEDGSTQTLDLDAVYWDACCYSHLYD